MSLGLKCPLEYVSARIVRKERVRKQKFARKKDNLNLCEGSSKQIVVMHDDFALAAKT